MSNYYENVDWDSRGFPGDYVYGERVYVDEYYMDERWQPIYDIPGYWVSTKARVWSEISKTFIWGTPLRSGHIDVSLRLNGRRIHRYLHRLVAEAFIPNPDGYPEVRHLDDDPSNNEVWNLAWGDQYANVQDCIRNGHFRYFTREDVEKANAMRRTPIVAVDLKSGKRIFFDSQQEASRQLGVDQSSIHDVIYGRKRGCNGYYFAFQKDFDDSFDHVNHAYRRMRRPVRAIKLSTGETRIYESARQAANDLGISEAGVSLALNGKSRYMRDWSFEYLYLDTEDDHNE